MSRTPPGRALNLQELPISHPSSEHRLIHFLQQQIDAAHFPGASWGILQYKGGFELLKGHVGSAQLEPHVIPLQGNEIYDVASLTKAVVTAPLCHLLVQEGLWDLDIPIRETIAEFPWKGITLRHLLLHSSGLPAWAPLYGEPAKEPLDVLLSLSARAEPGERIEYSCPNYILLGWLLQRETGLSLQDLAYRKIFEPLGMANSQMGRPLEGRPIVPTEVGNLHEQRMTWEMQKQPLVRDGLISGEVHDTNAHSLGGAAGNAGLFSTLEDLALWARELLSALAGDSSWMEQTIAQELFATGARDAQEVRSPGFQIREPDINPVPGLPGVRLAGHTGFTGTSLYFQPDTQQAWILLTNRVHPHVKSTPMPEIRAAFHSLCWSNSHDETAIP